MDSEFSHYRTRIIHSLSEIGQSAWDGLLQIQERPNPFLSYAFLNALHESHCVSPNTGWTVFFLTLWKEETLVAAMPLYEKTHSYGEYVFDWAWANAYEQHGLSYYPKLLSAIPFTPVEGNRLLSKNDAATQALVQALHEILKAGRHSSCHILFPLPSESRILEKMEFLIRVGVQFHWHNHAYRDFEDFLSKLEKKKRKNIRAERRKVQDAGVSFRHLEGHQIVLDNWKFFKRCYDNTYLEHHSTPYLNQDFFIRMGHEMPENIHLIIALKDERQIAASLLIHDKDRAYGRYWGCIEHISCLHFETAYYQAIEFCIAQKIRVFEGGAQGEHKIARGFSPQQTMSAHFLTQASFYDAVTEFLRRERHGVVDYIDELNDRSPFNQDFCNKNNIKQ